MPVPNPGLCRAIRGLALAAAISIGFAGASLAAETIVVVLDQAKIVRLPQTAQTVIVGNPGIADVTVQKNGVMIHASTASR